MTNKDYFISQLGFTASNNLVEGILTDNDIDGSEVYLASNRLIVKRAVLSGLYLLLTTPNISQGAGETSYSTSYDRNAVLKRIGILETELGIVVTGGIPTIKRVNVW